MLVAVDLKSEFRGSYKKNKYIIKCEAERATVFGTAWYQLNHSAIKVGVSE